MEFSYIPDSMLIEQAKRGPVRIFTPFIDENSCYVHIFVGSLKIDVFPKRTKAYQRSALSMEPGVVIECPDKQ
jgi:hypothetical protein